MIYRALSVPNTLTQATVQTPLLSKVNEKNIQKLTWMKNKMLANLPDTFQLTDEMIFRKYDFWRSRIFYVPSNLCSEIRTFHELNHPKFSTKMQSERNINGYAFIICKGIIQYLYEFRPRLWFDLPWPLDDILTKSRSSGVTSWPASSMNSINCGMC